MAHVAKYTRASAGHLCGHYDRSGTENRDDKNIDPSLTYRNYNLAADLQPLPQMEFLQKRCRQLKALNRDDVNILCDWIVTAPRDLSAEDEAQFFRETYEFLCKRYGEENVVSAYVHNDEPGARPHLHFAFVPVVYDGAKDRHKVNAKKCISRKELQQFHPELSAHLQQAFGRDVGVMLSDDEVLEEQQRKYKPMKELKRETAIKERLVAENAKLRSELNDAKAELDRVRQAADFQHMLVEADTERLEGVRKSLSEASESLQTTLASQDEYNAEVDRLRGSESPLKAVYMAIHQFAWVVMNRTSTHEQIVRAAKKILEPFPAIVAALANLLGYENKTNMPQPERQAPALVDDVNELISGAADRAGERDLGRDGLDKGENGFVKG